ARAASGVAVPVLRARNAPATASAGFDEGGIADAGDTCPEASGAGRGAGGDGCSDRPAALAGGGGDGVPDGADRCPQSPRGEDLDEDGCPDAVPAHTNPAVGVRAPRRTVAATVSYHYTRITRSVAIFDRLQVKHIPRRSKVEVRCAGPRCP